MTFLFLFLFVMSYIFIHVKWKSILQVEYKPKPSSNVLQLIVRNIGNISCPITRTSEVKLWDQDLKPAPLPLSPVTAWHSCWYFALKNQASDISCSCSVWYDKEFCYLIVDIAYHITPSFHPISICQDINGEEEANDNKLLDQFAKL